MLDVEAGFAHARVVAIAILFALHLGGLTQERLSLSVQRDCVLISLRVGNANRTQLLK